MFSDTHFHFRTMTREWDVDGVAVLNGMAQNNCFFGLDIGTKADDLPVRIECVEDAISKIDDKAVAQKAEEFCYFSAGIWPSLDEIQYREERIKILRENILKSTKRIVAIGEGGLDHHWNPSGVDGRCESDFDEQVFQGERELFEMQLELAKEMKLPFILHSRDAFEDTLDCLKNVGYHNGIVHCYSYGIDEARQFLDLGWYIAFGGAVTYNKKAKLEAIKELLTFVPEDRLLCETDAPYLSPVPLRGTPNTPVNIEHVYNFIADVRGVTPVMLSELVDNNIKELFKVGM